MKPFSDKQLRIFGPIVLFVVGTLFFRLNWYVELSPESLFRRDLIALGAGYFCWNLARWVVLRLQKQYPGLVNTRKRLIWMAILMPILVNNAWFIRSLGQFLVKNETAILEPFTQYTYSVGIQIFYHCVYFVIYEGTYILWAWQQAYTQNEQLKKSKLRHQLDTLKSQINPHFLFNSLNSLSILIHDKPRQAEAFIDELSNVYRYLLRTNGADDQDLKLTSLDEELQFIRSYFELLKTRYGEGIDLRIDVAEWQLDHKIFPLTLQLLVENAVKHNVISRDSPLLVEILTQGQSLVVQNNLQRRKTAVFSNKVGLANIAAKYRLVGPHEIVICEEDGRFMVTLPLLTGRPKYIEQV